MFAPSPTPGRPTPGRPTPGRPTPGPKKNYYPLPDPYTGNCPEDTFLITRGAPSQCFVGMYDDKINQPCLDMTNYNFYEELYNRQVPANKQLGYCAPKVGCKNHTDCPEPLQVDPISGKELQSKVWCAGEHSSPIFPHVEGGHCYISAEYPTQYSNASAFLFDECKKYKEVWDKNECSIAAQTLHIYADEVLHENDPTKCQERLEAIEHEFPKVFEGLEKNNQLYKNIRNDWCSGKIKPFYQKPVKGGRDSIIVPSDSGNPVGLCTNVLNSPSSCSNFKCKDVSSESECREHDCCRYILGTPILPHPFVPVHDWDPSQGVVNYGLIPRPTPGRPTPGRPTPGRPTPGRP